MTNAWCNVGIIMCSIMIPTALVWLVIGVVKLVRM